MQIGPHIFPSGPKKVVFHVNSHRLEVWIPQLMPPLAPRQVSFLLLWVVQPLAASWMKLVCTHYQHNLILRLYQKL